MDVEKLLERPTSMSSSDIRSILEKLSLVEGKTVPVSPKGSMTAQQERVPQLPALFKPKNISTTLTKKPYQKHPMDGYMVGENALAEAMQEVEEDMISKVKRDLNMYLDRIEQKITDDGRREKDTPELDKLAAKDKTDRDLIAKAVNAVERGQVEEDPTQQDLTVEPPPVPQQNPTLPESPEVITLEDGTLFEIHECDSGEYEIRHSGKSLPTRFPNVNHAKMAVDIFKSRKKMQQPKQQDLSQDYIEEK